MRVSAPRFARWARLLGMPLLVGGWLWLVRPARADAPVTDAAVKLAMVYNVGKFVDWPASVLPAGSAPFTLCVWGNYERLEGALTTIESKPVHGHELHVRRVAAGTDFRGCQILFLSDPDSARLPGLLAAAHSQSALTVSDAEHFSDDGGAVELLTRDNRVRFSVNLQAAQSASLTVSSDLLRLATRVIGGPHP